VLKELSSLAITSGQRILADKGKAIDLAYHPDNLPPIDVIRVDVATYNVVRGVETYLAARMAGKVWVDVNLVTTLTTGRLVNVGLPDNTIAPARVIDDTPTVQLLTGEIIHPPIGKILYR
jgi:hypothetical protein